jgi:hypothetical protein
MKKKWPSFRFLIWSWIGAILIILFLMLLVFNSPSSQSTINNIIQAIAVITLSFVTLFYAIQTKLLVQEQHDLTIENQKKIRIDFLERRIIDFFHPYLLLLDELRDSTFAKRGEVDWRIRLNKELYDLYWKRSYMTSISSDLITNLCNAIMEIHYDDANYPRESFEELRNFKNEIKDYLVKEWNGIVDEIKSYYSTKAQTASFGPPDSQIFSNEEKDSC